MHILGDTVMTTDTDTTQLALGQWHICIIQL